LLKRGRVISSVNTVTWNPADKIASTALSNGNLTAAESGSNGGVRATHSSNKKKYFEYTLDAAGSFTRIGFATLSDSLGGDFPNTTVGGGVWYYQFSQISYGSNGGISVSAPSGTTGDICGFALDHDTKTFWVHKNGIWMSGTGDPATGGAGLVWGTATVVYPMLRPESGAQITANFGASSFAYAPPVGFYAWKEIDAV
jgi:hypothetical protein